MPGMFGFASARGGDAPAGLLQRMALPLYGREDERIQLHEGQEFGFGRVELDDQPLDLQPVWNEDQTIGVLIHGEIYGSRDLRAEMSARGVRFRNDSAAELVLRLYEESGKAFPSFLNGAFAIAIWNHRDKELILVNDRLGLYPVYYCRTPRRFLFASGVRALLQDPELRRKLDLITVAQMLTFEHPLGDCTLVEGVSLLPPASVLSFAQGTVNRRSYWTLEFDDLCESRSEESYVQDLYSLLKQAVDRQKSSSPAAVLLSGGMDSRVVLAFLTENHDTDVRGFTFGVPGCTDGWMARELCAAAGVPHRFHRIGPDYLPSVAGRGVRLTDGMESVVHMHSLAHLDSQAQAVKLIYKGYFGGSLSGNRLSRKLWASHAPERLLRLMFENASTVFKETEHERLFSGPTYRLIKGEAFQTFRETFGESSAELLANRFNKFDLSQRQRRFSLQGVELVRNRVHVRTPWCDKDVVEFMLKVPPGLRLDRQLVRRMLAKHFPKLAKVPCTDTGFPLAPCARDVLMRIDGHVRWRLRGAGLRWVPLRRRIPYADYPTWFRTTLRGWIEGILLDRQSRERGYFDPGYVRQLVAEHMEGSSNHATRLGILMSLELWHRQLLDHSTAVTDARVTADSTPAVHA